MAAAAMDPELLALMGELGQLASDEPAAPAITSAPLDVAVRAPANIPVSERVAMDVLALLRAHPRLASNDDDLCLYVTRSGDALMTHSTAVARVLALLRSTPVLPLFAHTQAVPSHTPPYTSDPSSHTLCLSDLLELHEDALHRVVATLVTRHAAPLYSSVLLTSPTYIAQVVLPNLMAETTRHGCLPLQRAPHGVVPLSVLYSTLRATVQVGAYRIVLDFKSCMETGESVFLFDGGAAASSVLYTRAYLRTLIARMSGVVAAVSHATHVSSLPCDEPRLAQHVLAFVLSHASPRHTHVLSGSLITPRGHAHALGEGRFKLFADAGCIVLQPDAADAFIALARERMRAAQLAYTRGEDGSVFLFQVEALSSAMHSALMTSHQACVLSSMIPSGAGAAAESVAVYVLRHVIRVHGDVTLTALHCAAYARATHVHMYVHPHTVIIPAAAIREAAGRLTHSLTEAVEASVREMCANARAAADAIMHAHVHGAAGPASGRASKSGHVVVSYTRVPLLTLALVRRALRISVAASTPMLTQATTACAKHLHESMRDRYEAMRACVDAAAARVQGLVAALSRTAAAVHDDTDTCTCVHAKDAVQSFADAISNVGTRVWPETATRIPAANAKALTAAVETHVAREQLMMDACVKGINKLAKNASAAAAVDAVCRLLQQTHVHRLCALACVHVCVQCHIPLPPHLLHALVPPTGEVAPASSLPLLSVDEMNACLRALEAPRDASASEDAAVASKKVKSALRRAAAALSVESATPSGDAATAGSEPVQPVEALGHACDCAGELVAHSGVHVGVFTHKEEKEVLSKARVEAIRALTAMWHTFAAPARQPPVVLSVGEQTEGVAADMPVCRWLGTHSHAASFALAAAITAADALRTAPAFDCWMWDVLHARACPARRVDYAGHVLDDPVKLAAAVALLPSPVAELVQLWAHAHADGCSAAALCACTSTCTGACEAARGAALVALARIAQLPPHAAGFADGDDEEGDGDERAERDMVQVSVPAAAITAARGGSRRGGSAVRS